MEIRYKPLFTWWVTNLILASVSYWLYYAGVFHKVYDGDVTYISFAILGIFFLTDFYIGWHCWNVSWFGSPQLSPENDIEIIDSATSAIDRCWFIAEQMLSLGMLGTILGLIYMVSTIFLNGIGDKTHDDLVKLLTEMSAGMGTALYTTAAGLVCSTVMKVKLYMYSSHLARISG